MMHHGIIGKYCKGLWYVRWKSSAVCRYGSGAFFRSLGDAALSVPDRVQGKGEQRLCGCSVRRAIWAMHGRLHLTLWNKVVPLWIASCKSTPLFFLFSVLYKGNCEGYLSCRWPLSTGFGHSPLIKFFKRNPLMIIVQLQKEHGGAAVRAF